MTMSSSSIILSIRPKYADLIFTGQKSIELRRIRPKHLGNGDLVLVYVSSPVKSLVGGFTVKHIIESPIPVLWQAVRSGASLSRDEFDKYFTGSTSGVAIVVGDTWCLREPLLLEDLRQRKAGFLPPQSFRYATPREVRLACC